MYQNIIAHLISFASPVSPSKRVVEKDFISGGMTTSLLDITWFKATNPAACFSNFVAYALLRLGLKDKWKKVKLTNLRKTLTIAAKLSSVSSKVSHSKLLYLSPSYSLAFKRICITFKHYATPLLHGHPDYSYSRSSSRSRTPILITRTTSYCIVILI